MARLAEAPGFELPGVEWPKFRVVSRRHVVVSFLVDDNEIRDMMLTWDQAYEILANLKSLLREGAVMTSLAASRMFLEGLRVGIGQYGRHSA